MEKMFTLKSGRLPPADVKNIIFFVRPRLELMDIIADNITRWVYASHFQTAVKAQFCFHILSLTFLSFGVPPELCNSSVRIGTIRPETFIFCLCPGGACCVNSG